jgi:hypothetical protein
MPRLFEFKLNPTDADAIALLSTLPEAQPVLLAYRARIIHEQHGALRDLTKWFGDSIATVATNAQPKRGPDDPNFDADVLRLKDEQGMSYRDLADEYAVLPEAIRSAVRRARKRLE